MGGGINSSAATSEYGLLLLAKYPDIQEMVYDELQDVMKQNNLKEFNFKILTQLHIFRAFIYEVLRISNVAATGFPRMTYRDHIIEVNGNKMVIPEHMTCFQNSHFMHKFVDWNKGNKILKSENNDIHLEYWLYDDEDGNKKFKMNDNFVLFGVGKRNCVGQSLVMKALYVIFGLMMTNYQFSAKNDDPDAMNIKQKWSLVSTVYPPIGIQISRRN